jgi:hypothetical protein
MKQSIEETVASLTQLIVLAAKAHDVGLFYISDMIGCQIEEYYLNASPEERALGLGLGAGRTVKDGR